MKILISYNFPCVLCLVIILGACSRIPQTPYQIEGTQTPVPSTQTLHPSLSKTSTMAPTIESITTLPYQPIQTSTITPYPTLPSEVANTKLLELIHSNGGCSFPCIWNITPGYHEWSVIEQNLSTFLEIKQWKPEFAVPPSILTSELTAYISTKRSENLSDNSALISFVVSDTTIVQIIYHPQMSLAEILRLYGEPDQVYIQTIRNEGMGSDNPAFHLALHYSQKNFLVDIPTTGYISGSYLNAYPQYVKPIIISWSSDIGKSIDMDEIKWYCAGGGYQVKSLEETTQLSIEEFSSIYQNSDNKEPIRTPLENW